MIKKLILLLLLCSSALVLAQNWSGILSSDRATDWSYSGLPGGIPSGSWAICDTTACRTLCGGNTTACSSGTVTSANINTALAGAPASSVVKLPPGSFSLSGETYANRSNVVLRGAGPSQTTLTLVSNNIYFGINGTTGMGGVWSPSQLHSTNWTGGLTKGSTVLTLASTSGIVAGQKIALDQLNDGRYVFTNGRETGGCAGPNNSCGRNDCQGSYTTSSGDVSAQQACSPGPLQFYGSATRAQVQLVEVVSVDSSTQITIAAPGVAFTFTSGQLPQAFFWWDTGYTFHGNASYLGIENLRVNANQVDFALAMPYCDYCWVKNVVVTNNARSAVWFLWGYRDEVRDSYFASNQAGAPTQYGIEVVTSTATKIENNIFHNITAPFMPQDSYGLVAGYNFFRNDIAGNQFASLAPHLSHNWMHLYEGNIAGFLNYDNSWGSGSHNTAFRNRFMGTDPNKTDYLLSIQVGAHNRYNNFVGNVLGTYNLQNVYQVDETNYLTACSPDRFEIALGFWNSCGVEATPIDTVVKTSLMRWGNWDAVTSTNESSTNDTTGTRWCTASGGSCTASETASADATFPGLASPSQTFPASFYLAAKPSWWGSVAWPPIGPDVTSGNLANTGGHANKIPSELCYESVSVDGSGYPTNFDAATCYTASGGGEYSFSPSATLSTSLSVILSMQSASAVQMTTHGRR